MYCITEQQVDFILNDIRRRGVEMEDLQLNLLDHICCIVEQNLKEGEDFGAFYQKTIPKFFKRELWEIEEETITLLTFKHYYAMKKIMMTTGAISVISLLFGSFFKIMHWPGSGPLLVVGIATLSFVFLPLLFVLKAKESSTTRDKIVGATGTIVGILLCLATLFKIMHWPGASMLWFLASGSSIFLFIPLYFFTGIRKPETKLNTVITTIILVGATGLLFSLTSVRPSWTIERATFLANQDLAATYQYATTQNSLRYQKAGVDSLSRVKNQLLQEKSEKVTHYITDLIVSLVNNVDQTNVKEVDFTKLWSGNFGNYDAATGYLFVEGTPGKQLQELRKSIDEFNLFTKQNYNKESFGMINTTASINEQQGGTISWEEINFYHVPYGIVLRNLTQMQVDVRTVEAACIQ